MEVRSLAVGPALEGGGAHLHQHLVQPLQGPVQVHLDPAGGGRHCLAPVLLAPALHEADPDGAHPRQVVHGLVAQVDGLGEQAGELLVVEYFQIAARWNFADCCGMPVVSLVTIRTLNKNATIT